ncbi:hypothetical protein M2171_002573 [Bradyrhizobium japonicum USDA 38]|uniref:hypothetical protein n=1 Tax=Bradyrhizobium japonicum TaxID=375 RepID=UPI00041DA041|nr:hypothetical protein [Bradyrhizobium japonicum]MCS3893440.1 hypothetical protein [Bradyrhizobium japonicum USDA 38]MCS3945954.1 hypothetical protein [Bradyrhizobium japonicum]
MEAHFIEIEQKAIATVVADEQKLKADTQVVREMFGLGAAEEVEVPAQSIVGSTTAI